MGRKTSNMSKSKLTLFALTTASSKWWQNSPWTDIISRSCPHSNILLKTISRASTQALKSTFLKLRDSVWVVLFSQLTKWICTLQMRSNLCRRARMWTRNPMLAKIQTTSTHRQFTTLPMTLLRPSRLRTSDTTGAPIWFKLTQTEAITLVMGPLSLTSNLLLIRALWQRNLSIQTRRKIWWIQAPLKLMNLFYSNLGQRVDHLKIEILMCRNIQAKETWMLNTSQISHTSSKCIWKPATTSIVKKILRTTWVIQLWRLTIYLEACLL